MLGEMTLNTSSKTSSTALKSIEKSVQNEVNAAVKDLAKALNIHDFYSAHLLDHCEVLPMQSLTSRLENVY